jgi:hypothetical protein
MKVVVVLASQGGTEMCLGRVWVVTVYNCLVTYPEHGERARRIMEQAFGSLWIKPTVKVTAFNQEAQEAR